eukprot:Gb_04187 [translate_table: standard]
MARRNLRQSGTSGTTLVVEITDTLDTCNTGLRTFFNTCLKMRVKKRDESVIEFGIDLGRSNTRIHAMSAIGQVRAFTNNIREYHLEVVSERVYDFEGIFSSHCKMNHYHLLNLEDRFRNPVDYDWVLHKKRGNVTPKSNMGGELANTEKIPQTLSRPNFIVLQANQNTMAGGGDDNDPNKGRKQKSKHEEGGRSSKKWKTSKSHSSGGSTLKNKSTIYPESPSHTSIPSTRSTPTTKQPMDIVVHQASEEELTPNPWFLELLSWQSSLVAAGTFPPFDFSRQHATFDFDSGKKLVRIRASKPKTSKPKAAMTATNFSFQETELDVG